MIGSWIIFIVFALVSWLISHQLKRRFEKYSVIATSNGMSGREVAEQMLRDNGIYGVTIESVEGKLTDHYDPTTKTINLSEDVYSGRNVQLQLLPLMNVDMHCNMQQLISGLDYAQGWFLL